MALIFATLHGSRLYGLEDGKSDWDYYEVYTDDHVFENGERGQRVSSYGDVVTDHIRVTLEELLKNVRKGSHQAIEALFSAWSGPGISGHGPAWGQYGAMLGSMRVTSPEVFSVYERTIRKLAFGDTKRRQHAVRMALCLRRLREHGWFNPRLSRWDVTCVKEMANHHSGAELLRRLDIPLSANYGRDIATTEEES